MHTHDLTIDVGGVGLGRLLRDESFELLDLLRVLFDALAPIRLALLDVLDLIADAVALRVLRQASFVRAVETDERERRKRTAFSIFSLMLSASLSRRWTFFSTPSHAALHALTIASSAALLSRNGRFFSSSSLTSLVRSVLSCRACWYSPYTWS